jgi:hypothetical protein
MLVSTTNIIGVIYYSKHFVKKIFAIIPEYNKILFPI